MEKTIRIEAEKMVRELRRALLEDENLHLRTSICAVGHVCRAEDVRTVREWTPRPHGRESFAEKAHILAVENWAAVRLFWIRTSKNPAGELEVLRGELQLLRRQQR